MSSVRLVVLAVLAVVSLLVLASEKQQTLTGVVSDEMCGAGHMMPGKSDAECARGCVQEGSKWALVVEKKVYILQGHAAELDKLAGEKATVTGEVKGNTVQVSSVAAAK